MRLYWDTQKKDRERIVRQYEEAKLEATAEEVAAEQEAKEFIGKLGALIQEMDAKLKAAPEARRAAAAGETGETAPEGSGGFTPPEREPTGKREPETVGGPSLSTVANKTTVSTASQKPASETAEKPSKSSAETPVNVLEQSEELVENKEAGSENKPETKLSPGD